VKGAVEELMRKAGRGRVRVMWMDEARIGQQGTLTSVWAPKGSRPTAVKQTRYEWAYLYAAVEPATGFSSALLAPHVNTATMNAFLRVLSSEVDSGDLVVLMMDQAGWHKAKALEVPENIVLLHLPPYSPEYNPIEQAWSKMKTTLRKLALRAVVPLRNGIVSALKSITSENAIAWIRHTGWKFRGQVT
jgi:transposase